MGAWTSLADPQVSHGYQGHIRASTAAPVCLQEPAAEGTGCGQGAADGRGRVKECWINALQQHTTEEALQEEPREPGIQG